MKYWRFFFFFWCYFISLLSLKAEMIKDSIVLKKLVLNNLCVEETLKNKIVEKIKSHDIQRKRQKEYIYTINFRYEQKRITLDIFLVPRRELLSKAVVGFFDIQGFIFVLKGRIPLDFYSLTDDFATFKVLKKKESLDDLDDFDFTKITEEFLTWRFYYVEGCIELYSEENVF